MPCTESRLPGGYSGPEQATCVCAVYMGERDWVAAALSDTRTAGNSCIQKRKENTEQPSFGLASVCAAICGGAAEREAEGSQKTEV